MKKTIILIILSLTILLTGLVAADIELNQDTLTLAVCYEIQNPELDFDSFINQQPVQECELFLKQWDSNGDWYADEPEPEKGYLCINDDGYCDLANMEQCFDELMDYDSDCQDQDEDTYYTHEEIKSGTNPNDPTSFPWWIDLDNDNFRNLEELRMGSDPLDEHIANGWIDSDHDDYNDEIEVYYGTDPEDPTDFPAEQEISELTEEIEETTDIVEGPNYLVFIGIIAIIIAIVILLIFVIKHKKQPDLYINK